jgi:hypothetical protein
MPQRCDAGFEEASRKRTSGTGKIVFLTASPAAIKYQFSALALIVRQLSAQSRHAIAHSSMSPIFSQLSAHASQMSQQTRQICSINVELLNKKFDEVWHISAQFNIRRKCSGSTCLPPDSRHCVIAVCKQI